MFCAIPFISTTDLCLLYHFFLFCQYKFPHFLLECYIFLFPFPFFRLSPRNAALGGFVSLFLFFCAGLGDLVRGFGTLSCCFGGFARRFPGICLAVFGAVLPAEQSGIAHYSASWGLWFAGRGEKGRKRKRGRRGMERGAAGKNGGGGASVSDCYYTIYKDGKFSKIPNSCYNESILAGEVRYDRQKTPAGA